MSVIENLKYLNPLNIDEIIQKQKLKEVTSENTFIKVSGKKVLDPEGVYSETIFGPIGSSKRKTTFAYIKFPKKVINLYTYEPVSSNSFSSIFGKLNYQAFVFNGKPLYLMEDGSFSLEPFDDNKNIKAIKTFNTPEDFYNFIKNEQNTVEFNTFYNYQNTVKGNKKNVDFLIKNIDTIFTDKILVIPAAYRDIFIKDTVVQENPISKLYQYLIWVNKKFESDNPILSKIQTTGDSIAALVSQDNNKQNEENSESETSDKLTLSEYYSKVHNTLLKLANELVGILGFGQKGKLLRGAKLSKRVDHTVRLVLAHDNNLKPNQVKIPWMYLIKLYEPFVLHHILKNPKYAEIKNWVLEQLGTSQQLDLNQTEKTRKSISDKAFRDLTNNIVKNPKIVPPPIKEKFIQLLQEVINGTYDNVRKRVIVIRHPVESSDSILGQIPVIEKNNEYVVKLPQVIFGTLGADCSNDLIDIKVNDKIIRTYMKDLPKYVKHREVENYTRSDGVQVRILELLEPVEILAYDREKNEFVYDKVVFWHEHKNIEMVKVKMEDGVEFITSTTKEYFIDENSAALSVKEIVPKQCSVKRGITMNDIEILYNVFDGIIDKNVIVNNAYAILRGLGLLVTDGTITKNEISYASTSKELLEDFVNFKNVFSPNSKLRNYKHKGSFQSNKITDILRFNSAPLMHILKEKFGLGGKRNIPKEFYNLSDYAKSIFISAIIDGDGNIFEQNSGKSKSGKVYKYLAMRIEVTDKKMALLEFIRDFVNVGRIKKSKNKDTNNPAYKLQFKIPGNKIDNRHLILPHIKVKKKKDLILNYFPNIEKVANTVSSITQINDNVGWDITTLNTGTYVDAYGYVKKQCDGEFWHRRH